MPAERLEHGAIGGGLGSCQGGEGDAAIRAEDAAKLGDSRLGAV
jgi:hypothetical protein